MAEQLNTNTNRSFSGWRMIVFWAAMLLFACHASTLIMAAGDTWVAMACGRHFVNHSVDTVEPFSANSHRAGPTDEDLKKYPKFITKLFSAETIRKWHPTGWVNQNWLTHVIFYKLATGLGSQEEPYYNALIFLKFAIYIIAAITLYYTGKLLGAHTAIAAVFVCFAMFIGRTLFDVRPAGFSNLLVAVYLFVLALTTYRNVLYIWLIVPIIVFWCNVHGGYLYAFIMLVPFVGLHLLTYKSKKWFITIGIRGVIHSIAAGTVGFIAMIIFNPFHLTNLTHTFEISLSEHAEGWRKVQEWWPAFNWKNPIGDPTPFAVMFAMVIVLLIAWLVVLMLRPSVSKKDERNKPENIGPEYQWPKVDLAMITIAALTIYMAIKSRRFMPIAGFAACPVMALFVTQIIYMISAKINFAKGKWLIVPRLPREFQTYIILAALAITTVFGLVWGNKFYKAYLAPWPRDYEYTSIFMRMTASYAKPFKACEFMRLNNMKGNMFNYWTEGGAVAFGQNADPNTGKTPLQLFMDGRAQAAYNYSTFRKYMDIMYLQGCREMQEAYMRKRKPDYIKVGKWMDEQFKAKNVWVTLMPRKEFPSHFIKGLEAHRDWQMVFLTDKQKMFVDVSTKDGLKLYSGMGYGTTRYPDEYTKNFTFGYTLLFAGKTEEMKLRGLNFLIKANQQAPGQITMSYILSAARIKRLRAVAINYAKKHFDDFSEHKTKYSRLDGYLGRIGSALLAGRALGDLERQQKNFEKSDFYREKINAYSEQMNHMND